MRTSFWDIVREQTNLKDEMLYIEEALYNIPFYDGCCRYTLIQYIDTFYFPDWAATNKITCPTIDKLRSRLGIDELTNTDFLKVDDFLLYLEFAANLVFIVILRTPNNEVVKNAKNVYQNISTNCERLNFKLKMFSSGLIKIIEKNAATTAVADKYAEQDSEFSYKVIEYNHFLLKGKLDRKREILNAIATKFEAVRPQLKANGFTAIESDAGYLVNNLDIRHNNTDPQSNNHHAYVAGMQPSDLEEWYDKTYDVLLLALLASDFSELHGDIQELKKKIGAK